ncbi:MAG TPA: DNA polymerase I, partial [Gammaproteobacteria bacterium]|nr:DNA polymerase I [Gammaproteobacteria bacterium]
MPVIPKNPFILVDGSSYLFRAYHALPPLTTSKGLPTGAIYGVVNMLRKLIKTYHPEKMAVVFDSKEKNFRHALYEPYKANRTVMPDELQQQIEPLHAIIKAMGLPLVVIPGIEADDIIGTLAEQAKANGIFTLISTGDKDFAQLVCEEIFLINTMSDDIFDRERVIEKFEVPPEQIIDYLTLIGDTVDNVPGVPKVGPKTAVKWLQTYGSLEAVVAQALDIPGKIGENLRNALQQIPLFKELVTIQVHLPIEYKVADFVPQKPDEEALKVLFLELELKTWLKDLNGTEVIKLSETVKENIKENIKKIDNKNIEQDAESFTAESAQKSAKYETILKKTAFEKWLKKLENSELFVFDTETTSLDYMLAEIVGLSFAVIPGEAAYLPLAHNYMGAPPQLNREWVLEKLRPLLEDKKRPKIGHNLKYDSEVLANHGIMLQGIAFDTMLESYVLNSTGTRHDMDTLAERYLHYKTMSFEEVAGKGAKQITFNQVPLESAAFYAAEDADVTLKLHQTFWPLLQQLPKQKIVFETIEMPLVPVLVRMERGGVLIDPECLAAQSVALGKRLAEIETEAYQIAGQSFNINSPKQLQEILYTQLKCPVLEKTPTGQPSTAESVMQQLAEDYPLPQIILEYRSLSKLKSTYADKLPQQINVKTGRVHTSYHQAITSTGRLSSSDPNLQNIPIRSPLGRKIRSAFIAPAGYKIVAADYSQIELRIMAHMSQDQGLLKAFSMGDDVHQSTAAAVFGVSLEAVTSVQRSRAKAINFGLMYGMSAFGLAKQLGISRGDAEKQVERYFTCFPRVRIFMEEIRRRALEEGFVETLTGRRLYLPDLKSSYMATRRAAERAAINAPMQGTNADIIKLAMIQLDQWILQNSLDIRMIMQVHDELVFEVSEKILD